MQRAGVARIPSVSNDDLQLHFSSFEGVFERLDILYANDMYNMLDTSNCLAAYYKKGTEAYLGDYGAIKTFYKIRHEASMVHVPEKREFKNENGMLVMSIIKEAPDLGIYYEMELVGARATKEYYKTPDGEILFTTINNSNEDFRPANLELYAEIGDSVVVSSIKNAEFLSYEDLLRKYPQVRHVLDNDYCVIRNYEEAVERLRIWKESKEQLKSVDIESYHEKWGVFSDNRITGVFLGFGEHWSTYFPFRQDNFDYNLPIEFLREIFDTVNNQPKAPQTIILSHNAKFEIEGFYQEFRDFLRVDIDTYLLAVLVNPKVGRGTHTLKTLASQCDSKFYLSLQHIFTGKIRFNVLPPEIVLLYGCPDATSPAKVYKMLMEKLPKDEDFVKNLEMKLLPVKAMNEFYGLPMDMKRIQRLIEEEEFKVSLLADAFRKIHKTSGNINSYQVLKEILYDRLRCPVEVRTKKGLPATSVVAIDRIVELGKKKDYDKENMPAPILDMNGKVLISSEDLASNKYPSLIIYQKYKKCLKELGALRRLRDHSQQDRFMFYINQSGAGSNRQTSDAHQFSDTMKSCAIAESPYHGLVSCDWKQVELRVLAWLAGQEDLIKLECDPAVDIHRAILSIIQKKPMWMISEEDRKSGKSVNFGVVYMMTKYGLAARDFGPSYTNEQLRIEEKKITDFFNGLPKIKQYLASNENFLREKGYIKTKFNYYRYFPELLDPTVPNKTKKTLIRSGNNTPVQGTAAQMLKLVEIKVWKYIRKKGWHREKDYDGVKLPIARMMLPIHDEILFTYDETEITKEEVIVMFKECMELDFEGAPPFFAAPAFINNWYDGKDSAYEVDIEFRDKVVEEFHKGNYLFRDAGKPYLEVLNDFRNEQLANYMQGLIATHQTPEEVAKHVTDDSLTHTLIETMLPKSRRKKLTHTERILEATKEYMESLKSKGIVITKADAEFEKDETQAFMDTELWLETYSHIDSNGDLIVDDTEMEEELTDSVLVHDDILPMEDRFMAKPSVLYLMNQCWIDLTGLDIKIQGEHIYQKLKEVEDPNQHYEVVLVIGGKTYKTGMHVGYIQEELDKLFENLLTLQEV